MTATARKQAAVLVRVPLRTVSEANSHEHWRLRQQRAKQQRFAVGLQVKPKVEGLVPPLNVLITRVAPRQLDSDNLAASNKHVRDAVAECLGIDDGDERIAWLYSQRRAEQGEAWTVAGYGIEIAIWRTG